MTAKQLLYREQARQELMNGAALLNRAVKATLGPRGRNVIYGKKFGAPGMTKDGQVVAKEIELEKPYENMGARVLREAASKTGDEAGDGTTTATVLAEAIFREGLKHISAGFNPMEMKRGMEQALAVAREELSKMSIPIREKKEITQVATVAANHEVAIGEMIAEAVEKVGRDGVTTVEESKTAETELEVVEGMKFDKGYLSSQFVTSSETMKVELEDPYILMYEKKISALNDILPLLELVAKAHKPLLVVAEDVEGEVLATLAVNKARGMLACAAVKAPGYGERRKAMMQDMATLTAGSFISEDLAIKLENVTLSDLGRARRVVIDKESTTIVGGVGDPKAIDQRMKAIREQVEETKSDYEREKLQERLSKLAGGVAVVKVGGHTETEMKERKMRVEDALNATQAAIEEGIVPGGGVAYVRCIPALEKMELPGDQQAGVEIIKKALDSPLRQIAINSGMDASVVAGEVMTSAHNVGFNALTEAHEDLVKAGIVDPLKVVRTALENAVSVSGMMLITEALITEAPKKEEEEKEKGKEDKKRYAEGSVH